MYALFKNICNEYRSQFQPECVCVCLCLSMGEREMDWICHFPVTFSRYFLIKIEVCWFGHRQCKRLTNVAERNWYRSEMKRLCVCLSQCLASRTERSTIRTYFMCLFTMVCYNGSACIRIVHHVSHQFSGFLAVSRSVLLPTRGICQCNNLSVPSVLCVSVFGCAIRYIGEKRRRK